MQTLSLITKTGKGLEIYPLHALLLSLALIPSLIIHPVEKRLHYAH